LLYGADSFGIVIGCGIGEIERATGLNKQSIYRAIQQLKKTDLSAAKRMAQFEIVLFKQSLQYTL
jgi:hypothetical protein